MMQVNMKDNLLRLRKQKNVTQEAVAQYLGITSQSVGKWERGEGFPDITLLPALALYFGVTVDELLGVGKERIQKEVDEILDRADAYVSRGHREEATAILLEGLKQFPDNEELMYNLMYSVPRSDSDKIIELGEWILAHSVNSSNREGAVQKLVYAYCAKGNRARAKELAQTMSYMYVTSDELLCSVLTGEELLRHLQSYRKNLVDILELRMHTEIDPEKAAEKSIAFYRLMFENGDYGFCHTRLRDDYITLAKIAAGKQQGAQIVENLSKAADHALAFLEWTKNKNYKHTSLLFDGMTASGEFFTSDCSSNEAKELLNEMNDPVFDFLRNTDEFQKIVARLTPFAEDWEIRV